MFLVVVGFGAIAVALACRITAEEATRLGEEVRRLGDLQPAVVAIHREASRGAESARRLGSR